ncbi:MarR family transcriptional regulator [Aliivibrio fischeri]|uniref:MarR family transcriptional regulator n=1 Tax=Aliivibrio fischeri TaxID=668 RepID=UPI0007C5A5D6|nr:MarR family transcriptional regulator [Aliivibrio fischeri]
MISETKIKTFTDNIMAFRELVHDEIHPMQMVAFLEVMSTLPLTVSANHLCEKFGISQASASRHCRVLTDRAAPNRGGYDICRWTFDPTDHRTKYLELTEKGHELVEMLNNRFK